MAKDQPYIETEERPDLSIDLDKALGEATVGELSEALRGVGATSTRKLQAEVGDFKFAPDTALIGGNKASKDQNDKSSADIKLSNDHKLDVDNSNPSDGSVASGDRIIDLLRRLASDDDSST